ncbi:MAG: ferrous iron transport protein A [Clostridiales bacterium]|nr:ferrous iron transport protein A [Clostridiales bacterium]
MKFLSEIPEGEEVTIKDLTAKGSLRRRLQDLGFAAGNQVKCVLEGYDGRLRAYQILGAVVALRKEDAFHILTEGSEEAQ